MRGIVRVARHLALIALLLRALVPAGWMPGPADTPFVICTVDGAVPHAPAGHAPPDDVRQHDQCPFAAAPHLAKTPELTSLQTPGLRLVSANAPETTASARRFAVHQPQSPRAPPLA